MKTMMVLAALAAVVTPAAAQQVPPAVQQKFGEIDGALNAIKGELGDVDGGFKRIEGELDRIGAGFRAVRNGFDQVEAGLAASAAIGNLQFDPGHKGFQASVGVGFADDSIGGAIGAGVSIGSRAFLSGSVAVSDHDVVMGGAGLNVRF